MAPTPLDAPYRLSPEHLDAFRERGYVRLPRVLDPETLRDAGTAVASEVAARNPLRDKPPEQRTTYERAFIQVVNLWRVNETVRRFVFSRRLARIAAELMGVAGVRLYHDQALFKEAGGGLTPWHVDQYYWPLDTPNTCTAWIPLQETPLAMGPLAFSPGSHRFARGRDLAIGDESEAVLSEALARAGFGEDAAPFALGDVSFHYGWTFHRAGPNRTERPRRAMTIIYMADGARLIPPARAEHHADRDAFLPGLAPGDPAATPMNPLLFHEKGEM